MPAAPLIIFPEKSPMKMMWLNPLMPLFAGEKKAFTVSAIFYGSAATSPAKGLNARIHSRGLRGWNEDSITEYRVPRDEGGLRPARFETQCPLS